MATQGLQIAAPSGVPAGWGTGTSNRSFQRFVGTTAASSSQLPASRWATLRNNSTVAVFVRFSGVTGDAADNTCTQIWPNTDYHWVVQETESSFVSALSLAAGDLHLWVSEGSA